MVPPPLPRVLLVLMVLAAVTGPASADHAPLASARGVAVGIHAPLVGHSIADTGLLVGADDANAERSEGAADAGVARISAAGARANIGPGRAAASAEAAVVEFRLPTGSSLTVLGARSEASRTCESGAASTSVAGVLLDGVPLLDAPTSDPRSFALAGGLRLDLNAVTIGRDGDVQATAARLVLGGPANALVAESSAGLDGC